MKTAVIVQASKDSPIGYEGFGGARTLWKCKAPEVVIGGPYETGKTLACLHKLHTLLSKYPNSKGLMVRKTYKSLIASAVVTYEEKVLPFDPGDPNSPVTSFGGQKPEWYDYHASGSRLFLGGMDNPSKFLSAEFDFIYVVQAEEIKLDQWEKLTGRATGRAANSPYPQVIGDCNPDHPKHWIKQRERLFYIESRHEDNPTLFNQETGEITPRGKLAMATLDALTGVRYKRGRLGLWVGATGQVYENFDPFTHVIAPFDIPATWNRYRAIDFGYTNPFSCSWYTEDHDGRLYQYRQIYMTGRTVRSHHAVIHRLSYGENILATIADHDAEDRATLAEGYRTDTGEWIEGIETTLADKRIKIGIERVEERLRVLPDGKPRLFFFSDCLVEIDDHLKEKKRPLHTVEEFSSYIYPEDKDGRPNKEVPIDDNNHGMDELRYMVMYLDAPDSALGWDALDGLGRVEDFKRKWT